MSLAALARGLFAATILFLFAASAQAQLNQQTVFDPSGATSDGGLSGRECGLDPQHCTGYQWVLTATANTLHQHFSTLSFGYVNGEVCAFSAPPPGSRTHNRERNECPDGALPVFERLDTTSLPGPDYGLKRLRLCTGDAFDLQGIEAEFFKLPYLGRNGPGQEVVTRRYERRDCTRWESWSACPLGQAADRIVIHKETLTAGGIQGIELGCRAVRLHSAR